MNAMIDFRANGLGNNFATTKQRKDAAQAIVSNLRAKLMGAKALSAPANAASSARHAGGAAAKSTRAPGAKAAEEGGDTQAPDALGRDAFLQLLVQQMQNQDPLSPFDNAQMVAQLAQFSALEQMQNLNTSFTTLTDNFGALSGNVDQLNFIAAQGLLGKPVQGYTAQRELVEGTVDSVHQGSDGLIILSVDDHQLPMSGLVSVGDPLPVDEKKLKHK